jgi:two-component system sensor histidine kinase FlrB
LGRPQLATEQRERFAEQLGKQLAWLDGLVSRMMSFLRNKHGPSALVCVAELLDECRSTIEPLYDSKGVALKLEVNGGEHLLSVQRDQIRGGIVSLLENALQVSDEGQSVRVRARAANARLDVTVDDDGPGIPPEMMHRLFEPFATGSSRGTGLGLAIAKAAVEAHRGQIQAENRSAGGARFHLVLPVFEQL